MVYPSLERGLSDAQSLKRERKRLPGLEAFGRARVVDAMVAEFWVGMKWN